MAVLCLLWERMLVLSSNRALVSFPQHAWRTCLTCDADLLKAWVEENLDIYKVSRTIYLFHISAADRLSPNCAVFCGHSSSTHS